MDAERTEAIVLRRQPVTESSLIVTWFTSEFGKLKTIAKGARRPKSPFGGKIDLFYQDEILFLRSRRTDLHLLKDCFLDKPRVRLRDSVGTMATASYVCELVETATEQEDPHPGIFVLLADMLDELDNRQARGQGRAEAILIWFEIRLLSAAGWAPKWDQRTGIDKVLASLSEATFARADRVRLSDAQVQEARDVVWEFWDQVVGRVPRSRNLLLRKIKC